MKRQLLSPTSRFCTQCRQQRDRKGGVEIKINSLYYRWVCSECAKGVPHDHH